MALLPKDIWPEVPEKKTIFTINMSKVFEVLLWIAGAIYVLGWSGSIIQWMR